MSTLLMVLGGGASVVGGLMMLPVIWAEGIVWFLACLFIAPASIVFAILHWEKCKLSVIIQVAGMAVFFLGYLVAPPETRATIEAYASGKTPPDAPAPARAPSAAAPAPASKPAAPPPAPPAPPPDTRSPAERMAADCSTELSMLCSSAHGARAQLACLKENESALTGPCRKSVPDSL